MPYSFRSGIKKHMEGKAWTPKYSGATPTNMAQCVRLIWFMAHQEISLRPAGGGNWNTQLKFREGNEQEDSMANLIEESHPGVKITDRNTRNIIGYIGRHRVRGRHDGLIYDPNLPKNQLPLAEFKHMNEWQFMKLVGLGLKEAQPYYYDQIQTTIHIVRQVNERIVIPFGMLFAKTRADEVDVWDELIEYDPDHIDILEERLDERETMIKQDEPPERPYERGHQMCNGCAAEQIDWGGDEFHEKLAELPAIDADEMVYAGKMAAQYLSSYERMKEHEVLTDAIKKWFDNFLSDKRRMEIAVKTSDNFLVTPYIRQFQKTVLDELALRNEEPELARKHTHSKDVTQFRFRVVDPSGKTIRT